MPKARVLVIDDSLEMAKTIADYLDRRGFWTMAVRGGSAGITSFTAAGTDIVLVDLCMKDVDGLEVLDRVKEADPTVRVIVMSNLGGAETASEAIRRGAYHYLTKPFRLAAVSALLERACAGRT